LHAITMTEVAMDRNGKTVDLANIAEIAEIELRRWSAAAEPASADCLERLREWRTRQWA